jgi:PHD/YefM family antitoxin component YafN of YafNO toxin-antitoxin module
MSLQFTATEAKNRFGFMCAQAKNEPVFIEKDGRLDSVILSIEEFRALQQTVPQKSLAERKREFNETYKDWIAQQNEHFEKHGLWCEGLVAWNEGA